MPDTEEKCPKCGSPLSDAVETPTGKKLRRCSKGSWNSETKKSEGCNYVLWLAPEPQELDEKCPKCGAPLILQVTRFGKKMKKCSKGGWDKETKQATGCDFVEWINGTAEPLKEECPDCGKPLVLFTTNAGKKMKKCSTAGWDREKREATGCKYVQWLRAGDYSKSASTDSGGEENLPAED
jgi:uncharacterized Zn finger protein (UPF0148 family)